MSFIENLLENTKINVPCQTDNEYKIASNQCSWCAALFGLKWRELANNFYVNKENFLEIYLNCLNEGSELRQKYGTHLYGENIDSSNLKEKLNLKDHIVGEFTYLQKGEESSQKENLIDILPDDLKNEFYTRSYMQINNFSLLKSYKYCLISRHGQSFTVIPIGDMFLILDSHVHTVGLMSYDNLVKYIKYQTSDNNDTSYLHVTVLCCC